MTAFMNYDTACLGVDSLLEMKGRKDYVCQ